MRNTKRCAVLTALILAAGCGSIDDLISPGPNNQVRPILQRPFAGQFPNSWPFDHDLPLGTFADHDPQVSGSADVLTWRGETVAMIWGNGRHHDGYDWVMPEGTPLLAVADGEVVFAGAETPFVCGSRGEVAALIVSIRHPTRAGDVYESTYVHLNRIDVSVGEAVYAGQQIGLSGATGCASGPHVHFGVYVYGADGTKAVVDPFGWEGDFPDPWEVHSGVESFWLWKKGEAPEGDYSF